MPDEPLYDYENDVVTQEKAEELAAAGFDNDVNYIMSTWQGRKFIARLLYVICDLDGNHFTGNSKTYFNLGQREVARFVSDLIQETSFEQYLLMLRELRNGFIDKNDEVKNG